MQQAFLKNSVRREYLKIREAVSSKRRKEASLKALDFLTDNLPILSFASFKNEIDFWPLNHELAKRGKLLLPKMTEGGLAIYWTEIESLVKTKSGLLEPDPKNSKLYSFEMPILALVPGVAFDQKNNRLGLGKGYYDRFLKAHPTIIKWGVGFKEQLSIDLPIEDHDIPMDKVLFF